MLMNLAQTSHPSRFTLVSANCVNSLAGYQAVLVVPQLFPQCVVVYPSVQCALRQSNPRFCMPVYIAWMLQDCIGSLDSCLLAQIQRELAIELDVQDLCQQKPIGYHRMSQNNVPAQLCRLPVQCPRTIIVDGWFHDPFGRLLEGLDHRQTSEQLHFKFEMNSQNIILDQAARMYSLSPEKRLPSYPASTRYPEWAEWPQKMDRRVSWTPSLSTCCSSHLETLESGDNDRCESVTSTMTCISQVSYKLSERRQSTPHSSVLDQLPMRPLRRASEPAVHIPNVPNRIVAQICNHINLVSGSETRTSYMIKNIPNKYSADMLIDFINATHRVHQLTQGKYDFLYLRMDFKNKCNLGYAFINFANPRAAASFISRVDGARWPSFKSDKICAVGFAAIQGFNNLVERFRNSSVMVEEQDYRPIIFSLAGADLGERLDFPAPQAGKQRPRTDYLFSRANGEQYTC